MKKQKLRCILFFALCCDLGLFGKKLIAPAVNIITDALHIPGGIGTSFSIMFSVLAAFLIPMPGCATLMGAVQSVLALALGMAGSLGLLSPVGYIVPGIVIDCTVWIFKKGKIPAKIAMTIVNSLAAAAAAITASLLMFRLKGFPFFLYIAVGLVSGALCGLLAGELFSRLQPALRVYSGDKVLKSKRNRVILMDFRGETAVRKEFTNRNDLVLETEVYHKLENTGLNSADLLKTEKNALILSYINGINYVELVDEQEKTGYSPEPWDHLYHWLRDFHQKTGLVFSDPNLRNFLYDTETSKTYGLDFEECTSGCFSDMIYKLCAYILLYDPPYSETKGVICSRLKCLCLEDNPTLQEEADRKIREAAEAIRMRRERKSVENR